VINASNLLIHTKAYKKYIMFVPIGNKPKMKEILLKLRWVFIKKLGKK
jgi:hypothetical protein